MIRKKKQIASGVIFLAVGVAILSLALIGLVQNHIMPAVSILDRLKASGGFEQELKPGEFITIIDEKTGDVVDEMSRVVYTGDELIDENNRDYRITRVKGNKAYAKMTGQAADIVWKPEWDAAPAATSINKNNLIAIYHTHSDESYVPTDGSESIPAKGGILKVGAALAAQLKSEGLKVIDDKTPHEPHDANAYHRSRKTAVKLLQKNPVALLDIHRDGVPNPNFYNKKLDGEDITKVRLVVGRQNPKMASNLAFAKNIKAYMDKHKPGLIKGIFIGRGNYNQDLGTRTLLLEVGTHTNSRIWAEKGADLFADAFPAVLNLKSTAGGRPGGGITAPNPSENRSSWSAAGWIIGIIIIAGAAFLFISTGSIKGMKSKLGELGKTEFANFFGLKKAKRMKKKKKEKD